MSYQIVEEELRIHAFSIKDLKQEEKDQLKCDNPKRIVMIYDQKSDKILLNRDNHDYDVYELVATTYLKIEQDKRAIMKEQLPEAFKDTINLLEIIVKERERLAKLQEVKALLGKQPVGIYLDNMNIVRGLSDINEDECMRANYIFMYGYIQGIRAERAKRKARVC